MDRSERDREAEARARGLVDLVRPHLPLEGRTTGPADAWPLVGPALIARQVGTVEGIFGIRPQGRDADPMVLLRSLYDHAVTFAWLAADPGKERHQCFLRSDAQQRLKADDDCRKIGIPMLGDEMRAKYQRQVDTLPAEMPPLAERAKQADGHWTERIEALRGPDTTHSYRGFYAFGYRRYSSYEHASVWGLNSVTVDLPEGRQRVQLEEHDPDEHGVYGTAGILLAFSLFIAAQTIGWPDTGAVEDVFERTASRPA
jgi:hypothetical protein